MRKIKRIAVLTSGGDAPGMNAAIRAVTRAGINNGLTVYGVRMGYKGLMEGDMFEMTSQNVSGIIQTGGTFLRTARSEEFKTPEGRMKGYEQLKKNGIDALVVIGGDGSFTAASLLANETDMICIGIPGTIDNDLYGTDYTIGYDTAVNTVMEAVDKIRDTASSHNRIFFVEVMGREAGFIAINACIACGAEMAIIPEETSDQLEKVRLFLSHRASKNKSSIILIAEGAKEGGALEISKKLIAEYPDFDIKVSILGHMQRGGSPSSKDRIVASLMGIAAIEALLEGQRSIMIGYVNEQTVYVPLSKTVKMHKTISHEYVEKAESIGTFTVPQQPE